MDKVKARAIELWNGNVPLAQTFWLYYVVGVVVLRLIAMPLGSIFGIAILGWAGFMVVPIWRASDKYEGENLLALLAKIAAVFIAIAVLGSLLR